MEDKLIVKGMYWSAGDHIFIDHKDDEGKWQVVCLNDLLKKNLPDNSIIEIEITIKKMGGCGNE